MTLAGRIAWDDMVLPFQLDRADIRGRVARVDSVLDTILGQHAYPDPVAALIAEATLLTALIGQTVRPGWRLSLQVRGGGAIRLIATDYFAAETDGEPARMRAYAAFDPDQLRADTEAGMAPFAMMGEGIFGILIDQGTGAAPYQGITPLAGESLSHCAETYFAQSEQLPTRFALSYGRSTLPGQEEHWRAGGVMIQLMPKASSSVAASMTRSAEARSLTSAEPAMRDSAVLRSSSLSLPLDTWRARLPLTVANAVSILSGVRS